MHIKRNVVVQVSRDRKSTRAIFQRLNIGAKCGSTSVDRRFTEWMTLKFGAAFTSLDLKKRGPGSLFMQAFESAKRHFGHRDSSHIWYEIEPLDMELEAPSVNYDEDEQCVKIPR